MATSRKPITQTKLIPNRLREWLRVRALDGLSRADKSQTERALLVPRVQNLYLHFLPTAGEHSFRQVLKQMKQGHSFVSFSQAVQFAKAGKIDQPYMSVSFDDGFASNLRAAQILADEGISACFFICPGTIGLDRSQLERVFSGGLGAESRTLTWAEVEQILDLGHEIGNHTLEHPVLSGVSITAAYDQIHLAKEELDRRLGEVHHFAWPRGRFHHFRKELVEVVAATGHVSCSSAVRGAHTEAGGQWPCIYREHWDVTWPTEHLKFLLGKSIRSRLGHSGEWPTDWALETPASL